MGNYELYESRHIVDLRDMFESSCAMFSERTAFLSKVDGTYRPTLYREFWRDICSLGTMFVKEGFTGKKIAVVGEACYEWALTYAAVVSGLGVIVPIDKELPAEEIANLLCIAEAEAVVSTPKSEEKIRTAVQSAPCVKRIINTADELHALIKKGAELADSTDEAAKAFKELPIDCEKMAVLLFTSGTTGVAKGVMLSHKNICTNLEAMTQMLYIYKEDVFLSVLPIHHTYECTCGYLCPIYRGSTVAYSEGLRRILKNMEETKATMMLAVPLLVENIYKNLWKQAEKTGQAKKLRKAIALSNFLLKLGIDKRKKLFASIHQKFGGHFRMFVAGAAAIDPNVSRGFRELGINVFQGYGMTECAPIGALNRDRFFRDDSIGLPLPGVEIRIDSPDSEGNGEICLKGGNVMIGYYKNEEATAQVLRDGWLYTGDVGHIDEDGFVYLTGRKKNVIVTKNGKNVFPEEIETYLNRILYVSESLITGRFDSREDDVVIAAQIIIDKDAVAEKLGATYEDDALHELIQGEIDKLNISLPAYKRVTEFSIRTEAFHKTTTQKIKRHLENK
ncbi:MAG: AMP-binding protein [Clostridia bacterium]|nr:AMP-binding protein [Clostridia bacterium]